MAILHFQTPNEEPDPNMLMPFGKYKGKALRWIAENDVLYLDWLAGASLYGPLEKTVAALCQEFSDEIDKALDL